MHKIFLDNCPTNMNTLFLKRDNKYNDITLNYIL